MKLLRVAAVFLLLGFAVLQQGCGAAWSVDFTTVSGIDDWKRVDWFSPWEGELYGTSGLYIDGKVFSSPLGFDGNFTLEIVFSINTSSTVDSIHFFFNMGHPALLEWVEYTFIDVGDPIAERFIVSENAPLNVLDEATRELGFKMDGNNLFKLVKTGKNLKSYLNGKSLSNCTFSSYDYDLFFPNFTVDQENGEHHVFIKSINVKFQDSVYSNLY